MLAWSECCTALLNDVRICDARLPITGAQCQDAGIEELLRRTCPASDPGDGACLAFSLVGAQFVDAHALGQPQRPWQRYVLVQALLQQNLAGEAMRDCATQSPQTGGRDSQVMEPLLSC